MYKQTNEYIVFLEPYPPFIKGVKYRIADETATAFIARDAGQDYTIEKSWRGQVFEIGHIDNRCNETEK